MEDDFNYLIHSRKMVDAAGYTADALPVFVLENMPACPLSSDRTHVAKMFHQSFRSTGSEKKPTGFQF